jgi:hypothetical protein
MRFVAPLLPFGSGVLAGKPPISRIPIQEKGQNDVGAFQLLRWAKIQNGNQETEGGKKDILGLCIWGKL